MVERWCKEHRQVWFRKGKMKGYAHPILDENGEPTGEWCNEPKEKAPPGVTVLEKVLTPLGTPDPTRISIERQVALKCAIELACIGEIQVNEIPWYFGLFSKLLQEGDESNVSLFKTEPPATEAKVVVPEPATDPSKFPRIVPKQIPSTPIIKPKKVAPATAVIKEPEESVILEATTIPAWKDVQPTVSKLYGEKRKGWATGRAFVEKMVELGATKTDKVNNAFNSLNDEGKIKFTEMVNKELKDV